MPFLIDGHNLVPKIPGLSLDTPDDEQRLVEMLLVYCRTARRQVECFFDRPAAGFARVRRYGAVVVRFPLPGKTADDSIHSRLHNLGRAAKNWTVVSSDRGVQAAARAAHARVMPAEAFTAELLAVVKDDYIEGESREDVELSAEELEEWLEFFDNKD